jgi:epsin
MGGFSDSGSRQYEEYDAGGDETLRRSSLSSPTRTTSSARSPRRQGSAPTPTSPAAPAPAPNLLDFDDDDVVPAAAPAAGLATNKALPKPVGLDGMC